MINNINEFIDQIVHLDYLQEYKCYGHYPFQLYVEMKDDKIEMNALMLGGDVFSCYKRVKEYVLSDAKKIFLSLDFPKSGDMEHDFICVFSVIGVKTEILAIPYDEETGEKFEYITKGNQLLDRILNDFESVIYE